ncbi:uncharacterized protein LOC144577633 isoform X2 [Callithrix jacchus]
MQSQFQLSRVSVLDAEKLSKQPKEAHPPTQKNRIHCAPGKDRSMKNQERRFPEDKRFQKWKRQKETHYAINTVPLPPSLFVDGKDQTPSGCGKARVNTRK